MAKDYLGIVLSEGDVVIAVEPYYRNFKQYRIIKINPKMVTLFSLDDEQDVNKNPSDPYWHVRKYHQDVIKIPMA